MLAALSIKQFILFFQTSSIKGLCCHFQIVCSMRMGKMTNTKQNSCQLYFFISVMAGDAKEGLHINRVPHIHRNAHRLCLLQIKGDEQAACIISSELTLCFLSFFWSFLVPKICFSIYIFLISAHKLSWLKKNCSNLIHSVRRQSERTVPLFTPGTS